MVTPPAPQEMVVGVNIRGGVEERKGRHNKARRERDVWEKEGAPRGEVRGEGWPGERGKVVVFREGWVLSEVAAWNHPQLFNSYIISINHGTSGD